MRGTRRTGVVRGSVLYLLLIAAPAAGQDVFPPAGFDTFDSEMTLKLELLPVQGGVPRANGSVDVTVTGPVVVHRGDPVDPGDGLREIPTEIVQLELSGTSPLGAVSIHVHPEKSSEGLVKAQDASGDFLADSSFNVFVKVVIGQMTLINKEPFLVRATNLTKLPPIFDTYTHPPPAIDLFAEGDPDGPVI